MLNGYLQFIYLIFINIYFNNDIQKNDYKLEHFDSTGSRNNIETIMQITHKNNSDIIPIEKDFKYLDKIDNNNNDSTFIILENS